MRRKIKPRYFGGVTTIAVASIVPFLAGCGPAIDRVPTELGGLPPDAPRRTAPLPNYPAVHDVPAPRTGSATPLTDADQLKLEKELAAARRRQTGLQDPTVQQRGTAANADSAAAMEKAKEAAKAAAKKKPSPPNDQ